MELTYEKNGDYLITNLIPNSEPEEPLTKYGLMRKNYLKEHMGGVYTAMLLKGTLKEHCLEIQHQAEHRMDLLTAQMAEAEGWRETESVRPDEMGGENEWNPAFGGRNHFSGTGLQPVSGEGQSIKKSAAKYGNREAG